MGLGIPAGLRSLEGLGEGIQKYIYFKNKGLWGASIFYRYFRESIKNINDYDKSLRIMLCL